MTLKVLHELSSPSLRSLAASLREGTLSSGITRNPLQQLAGAAAADLQSCLERLIQSGMTPPQIALLVDAIADERTRPSDISAVLELVISGPDVPGIPTADTAAVMHSLIEERLPKFFWSVTLFTTASGCSIGLRQEWRSDQNFAFRFV